jgi:ribosome biogenesis protein Nip4
MVIKSRRMGWVGHVAHMGGMRNVYKILVRKPEQKRPLRRLKHRWEDNIRKDLREIGWKVVDYIHMAQDRDQWQVLVTQ